MPTCTADHHRASPPGWLLAGMLLIVPGLASAAISWEPGFVEVPVTVTDTGSKVTLVLPADKQEQRGSVDLIAVHEVRDKIVAADAPNPPEAVRLKKFSLEVRNAGKAPMEVLVRVEEEGYRPTQQNWQLAVDGDSAFHVGPQIKVNLFRDLVFGSSRTYDLTLLQPGKEFTAKARVLIWLRRPDSCLMSARYSGDLDGFDFGNLAFYNTFHEQGGVSYATGSVADPALLTVMEGWLATMAGDGAAPDPEAAYDDEGTTPGGEGVDVFSDAPSGPVGPRPPQTTAGLMQEFREFVASGGGEVPVGQREMFGLTLFARKIGEAGPMTEDDSLLRDVFAFKTMTSAFQLEAASVKPMTLSRYGELVVVPLSRLVVAPGDRFAGSDDKAPFIWTEGQKGSASMGLYSFQGGFIGGEVKGTLYSKKVRRPDGEEAMINVTAQFYAARTAIGCDTSFAK